MVNPDRSVNASLWSWFSSLPSVYRDQLRAEYRSRVIRPALNSSSCGKRRVPGSWCRKSRSVPR